MIEIPERLKDAIRAHAEQTYPYECGGMLLGTFGSDGQKAVNDTLPLENSSEENQTNRVLILPKDVLKAEMRARESGVDLVGYYHSHPEDGAVPSQYDLDHALPVWSYVIVSVLGGKAVDMKSWVMRNDRSRFDEEEISNM